MAMNSSQTEDSLEDEESLKYENEYYQAKEIYKIDPHAALETFEKLSCEAPEPEKYKWNSCKWTFRLGLKLKLYEKAIAATERIIKANESHLIATHSQASRVLEKIVAELSDKEWPPEIQQRLWEVLYTSLDPNDKSRPRIALSFCNSLLRTASDISEHVKILCIIEDFEVPKRSELLRERTILLISIYAKLGMWEEARRIANKADATLHREDQDWRTDGVIHAIFKALLLKSPEAALLEINNFENHRLLRDRTLVCLAILAREQIKEGSILNEALPALLAITDPELVEFSSLCQRIFREKIPLLDESIMANPICNGDNFIQEYIMMQNKRNKAFLLLEDASLYNRKLTNDEMSLLAHMIRIGTIPGRINELERKFLRITSQEDLNWHMKLSRSDWMRNLRESYHQGIAISSGSDSE